MIDTSNLSIFKPNSAYDGRRITSAQAAIYQALWKTLKGTPYPDPVGSIQLADATNWTASAAPFNTRTGTLYYSAGRVLGTHYYALALLLMTAHDPAIVDELMRLMALFKPLLLKYPDQTQAEQLDEIMTYNLVAFHAIVMAEAGQADESAYWLNVVLTHIDSVWGGRIALRNLAHVWLASGSMAWYLHLLTNRAEFLTQAIHIRNVFQREAHCVNGGLWWDHRMPLSFSPLGAQDIGYARYTVQYLLFAHLTGYTIAAPEMLAATIANIIHADGTLANAVDGSGTFRKAQWLTTLYGAFAKWDETGKIAPFSATHGLVNTVFVPICQLFANGAL